MNYVYIEEETLLSLANTIREKTGFSDKISIGEIIEELANMKDNGKFLWHKKESEDGEIITCVVNDDENRYPDGDWKDGYYWKRMEDRVELITFNVDGIAYQAEEGMTWADWYNSEYYNANVYYSPYWTDMMEYDTEDGTMALKEPGSGQTQEVSFIILNNTNYNWELTGGII